MGARVKPKNCVGKKGRSGRKSYPVELARINVIKRSWNILDTHLETIDNVNVALPIALKDMTERVEHSGNVLINYDSAFNTSPKTEGDNPKQSEV